MPDNDLIHTRFPALAVQAAHDAQIVHRGAVRITPSLR
jgi:hypothetical protein